MYYDENRVPDYFSDDYFQAREKFLGASSSAGARIDHYENPHKGPDGKPLFSDVARFGSDDASRVFFTNSGIHGPEGFAGSAAQVSWIDSGQWKDLPGNVAVVHIHASNPYGFAWGCRENEDFVDCNRNFLDFPLKKPIGADYEILHPFLLPAEWNEKTAMKAKTAFKVAMEMAAILKEQGEMAGCQSVTPGGLGYVGNEPTWTNRTLREIVQTHAGQAQKVALLDYHTGIEPYGHLFFFSNAVRESALGQRIFSWFGDAVKWRSEESAKINAGQFFENVASMLPHAEVTPVLLEFSGRPENWPEDGLPYYALIANGMIDSDEAREAAVKFRDIFYPGEDMDWKEAVVSRSLSFCRRVTRGLGAED